jgi:L-alanine-DL-glutamate epimerase-like enolase superfamily enzyme
VEPVPIRAYASYLFGETPAETEALARQAVEQGLSAVKFGWGPFGQDEETDLAHVLAARRGVGPWCDLMVDVGCKWDAATALARAEMLAPLRIAWLEEPLSQDDLAGYRRLCRQAAVPIAAGEGGVTRHDFEALVAAGVHILQPDVAFCGGLTVCREVSALARQAGRRAVPHCFSTGINLTASLHWMAATGGDLIEYCLRPSPLLRRLAGELPPLVDGKVSVPRGPGLGIGLDESVVEAFRVG